MQKTSEVSAVSNEINEQSVLQFHLLYDLNDLKGLSEKEKGG